MFIRLAVILLAALSVFAQDLHSPHANFTIGFLIFPGIQALDVLGPVDLLNMLAEQFPGTVHLITIGETLDDMPTTSKGYIKAEYTIYDHPHLDVLFIPGGAGTDAVYYNTEMTNYVRNVYPKLKYIASVCVGAAILAKSGVLDGKRATSSKYAWPVLTALNPTVNWVPQARWVVDGNIWTSSGVTAGMDLTYAFMTFLYGNRTAERVAAVMEYGAHTDPSWDPFSEYWNVTGTGAQTFARGKAKASTTIGF